MLSKDISVALTRFTINNHSSATLQIMHFDVFELAADLQAAKDAHTEYERTLPDKHHDWEGWYADFLIQRWWDRAIARST